MLVDNYYNTKFFLGGFPTDFEMQLSFPYAYAMKAYLITSGNALRIAI